MKGTRRDDISVYVDYAHTPDALTKAISSIKALSPARTIVVFGCGGNRDSSEAIHHGQTALAADYAIVTSDNPRHEDPLAIIDDIPRRHGGGGDGRFEVEPTRAAIARAVELAEPGDCVLLAGKGTRGLSARRRPSALVRRSHRGRRGAQPLGRGEGEVTLRLNFKQIAAYTGGEFIVKPIDAAELICGITWDSREVEQGWLYVALPGERVDGHDYVGAALRAGARCALVAERLDASVLVLAKELGAAIIEVPNTASAVTDLARGAGAAICAAA